VTNTGCAKGLGSLSIAVNMCLAASQCAMPARGLGYTTAICRARGYKKDERALRRTDIFRSVQ